VWYRSRARVRYQDQEQAHQDLARQDQARRERARQEPVQVQAQAQEQAHQDQAQAQMPDQELAQPQARVQTQDPGQALLERARQEPCHQDQGQDQMDRAQVQVQSQPKPKLNPARPALAYPVSQVQLRQQVKAWQGFQVQLRVQDPRQTLEGRWQAYQAFQHQLPNQVHHQQVSPTLALLQEQAHLLALAAAGAMQAPAQTPVQLYLEPASLSAQDLSLVVQMGWRQ
jgi:hypothetical protein